MNWANPDTEPPYPSSAGRPPADQVAAIALTQATRDGLAEVAAELRKYTWAIYAARVQAVVDAYDREVGSGR